LAENQMNCFVEGSDLFTEKRMFSASGNVILDLFTEKRMFSASGNVVFILMFFADFSLH